MSNFQSVETQHLVPLEVSNPHVCVRSWTYAVVIACVVRTLCCYIAATVDSYGIAVLPTVALMQTMSSFLSFFFLLPVSSIEFFWCLCCA